MTTALSGPDGPEWQAVINYEINQLEKLKVWKIITPPCNANIIPCHFVIATKRRPNGEKLKLRARLVANGQCQKHSIDYAEMFAPMTNMTTIHAVMSIAMHRDWEIHQIDVKSAYLNAQLHDDIYMHAPPGYLKAEDLGKVLKLLRSLYGLVKGHLSISLPSLSYPLLSSTSLSHTHSCLYVLSPTLCTITRYQTLEVNNSRAYYCRRHSTPPSTLTFEASDKLQTHWDRSV
jgi:hypothetical protein